MSTIKLSKHRFSNPMVYRGNHNEEKSNKINPKSKLIDRRYSWTGEVEKPVQWNGKHSTGKRPSTADSICRKAYSSTSVEIPSKKTDKALHPMFKCQGTQTCLPNTSAMPTQIKPKASNLKSTVGVFMNPVTNYSHNLKRPKSAIAPTAWKHNNDVLGSNSRLIKPFISCQNIPICRTSSSFTSASWGTKHRSSISKTKLRRASLHSFPEQYQELCERYRQIPLPGVKKHLPKSVLDFSVDRLMTEDWKPLSEALYTDRELNKICVRSLFPTRKLLESEYTLKKVNPAIHCPVIFSEFFLSSLTSSLAHCLTNSNSLTFLELEGIPLPPRYLSILIEGLVKSKSLQHLSFKKCFLGDDGFAIICKALKQLPSVITLNVTMCGITAEGIGDLVSLLKYQKMTQYMETWQQSLRYQIPNLNSMSGLRRITLNHNPSIGDEGVTQLCDILEDDLWIRALDLQSAGVGVTGASKLISLLHLNETLAIVDVRGNKNIPSSLHKQIMQLLSENNQDQDVEFEWINSSSSPQYERKPKVLAERNFRVDKKQANRSNSASALKKGTDNFPAHLRIRAYCRPIRQ